MTEIRAKSASELPGFRRRLRVVPGSDAVLAMLEDDLHCMAVILVHDGQRVTQVLPDTARMPWNACPAAAQKLVSTFAGSLLKEVTARVEKKQNCTHLHDLAVIAAAHALDGEGFTYEVLASDPVEGVRILEILRDGTSLHRWIERDGVIEEPQAIAGLTLLNMRDWIASLKGVEQESARLLQWSSLVAHGRTMTIEEQSRAVDLPPNCFTFQPERAVYAERVGDRFDFSDGTRVPLEGFGDRMIAKLERCTV